MQNDLAHSEIGCVFTRSYQVVFDNCSYFAKNSVVVCIVLKFSSNKCQKHKIVFKTLPARECSKSLVLFTDANPTHIHQLRHPDTLKWRPLHFAMRVVAYKARDWSAVTPWPLSARAQAAGRLLYVGEVDLHALVEFVYLVGQIAECLLIAIKLISHHCKESGAGKQALVCCVHCATTPLLIAMVHQQRKGNSVYTH